MEKALAASLRRAAGPGLRPFRWAAVFSRAAMEGVLVQLVQLAASAALAATQGRQ
jgi:hypothetical protein